MADIVNTLRGRKLLPDGTIRGSYYVIPVREPLVVTGDIFKDVFRQDMPGYSREYYQRGADGEWHWSHTEKASHRKYPCYQEPEWTLPEGV